MMRHFLIHLYITSKITPHVCGTMFFVSIFRRGGGDYSFFTKII